MRKVDDGEEKREKKEKEKRMTFIVATNIVASRPPERRPTGTPHARAKIARHTPGARGHKFELYQSIS